MKTILVPVDFSASSKNVLDTAVNLAQKVKATLVLLHVIEVNEEGSFNVEGEIDSSVSWEDRLFDRMLIKKAQAQLKALKEEIELKGIKTLPLLRLGSPFHSVASVIIEHSANLVIMGAGNDDEAGLGSITEKIIRRATCPVLTVNKMAHNDFNSIVLATSLSDAELVMSAALQEIIAADNSVIHLVRINTPGGFEADYKIKDKLKEFANRLKIKRYTLNIFNDYNEEAGIIHFAESVNADLIAMTTHGRTGIAHIFARSIAEDVISHAPIPVLTYSLKSLKS
jgi:nucleotide-binding universal stress UspA family protein